MTQTVRVRVVIYGWVQGVFFRDTTRRRAEQRGVNGWVRNRADGSVEAVFEGATNGVERLVGWAHRGPSRALVDKVEVYDEAPEGLRGFEIRPTPWRL